MDSSTHFHEKTLVQQNNSKQDYNVHEIALHAMRDRCVLLQKRINALESDNMRLKFDSNKMKPENDDGDILKLHQKISELTKQKSQLLHQVFMVHCENKNLWKKIANLNKPDKLSEVTIPPLIRTNTYIQSTPKINQERFSESSLEEISLKVINSYIEEKSQLVEQYEQMAQLQISDDDGILNPESIGFTYMGEPIPDSLKEIYNQTEMVQNLTKQIQKQEKDLNMVMNKLQKMLTEGFKCPTCREVKPTSEHKESETSDSLTNFATPVNSSTYHDNFNDLHTTAYKHEVETDANKLVDKICPMCGECFGVTVEFAVFQSHVENHFTGELDLDSFMAVDTSMGRTV